MQESFIFYRSYSEAIKKLPEKEQLKALWAIINHSIDEKEQHVEGLANIVYIMAKPQIEANNKRKNDGLKGGRPLKETSGYLYKETTGFENEKPNVNKNVNDNANNNINANANGNEKEIAADKSANPLSKTNKKFIPPTAEEVKDYCLENKNNINPEAFVAFYDSKGWKIGKETMKDWKKAVTTWEIRDKERAGVHKNQLGDTNLFQLFSGDELMEKAVKKTWGKSSGG